LLEQDEPNQAELDKRIKALTDAQGAATRQHIEHRMAFRRVLTPEQRTKLRNTVRQHMRHRMMRFREGGEGRMRLLEHSESFPLDGAFVAGIGTLEFDAWMVPMAGLSLGRRVDFEGVSFVAYTQPTLGFVIVDTPVGSSEDLYFGLGFGADFKIGTSLDLRTSIGFFDVGEGLAVSLVWVR